MCEFITDIITNPFLSIAAAGVGYLVGHFLAKSRSFQAIKIVEFNKAAAQFRAAFVGEQCRLRGTAPKAAYYLQDVGERRTLPTMIAHEEAKILFEPFVSDVAGFNRAWEFYSEGWHQWLEDCMNNQYKGIEDFLVHYWALLEYAEPKLK